MAAGRGKEMEIAIKIAGKVESSFKNALGAATKGLGAITKTVASATAAAAAAVGAMGIAAINTGKEFEGAMSQVAATMLLDKTTAEGQKAFETLENAARECGASTAFSATEAAEALNYLALAGYDADKAATALPTVLKLAGAGAMELAAASDMVTDSMSALGIAATEANLTQFSDQLAKTASKSNTSVAQLGEAILTVGGTAKGLAGGTTELNTSLGILADSGIKASEGGTHLRNMILALQQARNSDAAAIFEEIGFSAYDAEGKMRGLGDIFGDFNTTLSGASAKEVNSFLATVFKQTDLASARAMLAATADSVESLGAVLDASLADSGTSVSALGIDLQAMADNFDTAISQEQFAAQMLEQFGMTSDQATTLFTGLQSVVSGTGNRFEELSAAIEDSQGACEDMYAIQLDNLNGDIDILKSGLSDLGISVYKDLNGPLRESTQMATSMVGELSKAYKSGGMAGMVGAVGGCLSEVVDEVADYAPKIVSMGVELIESFVQGITENADSIGSTAAELITTFVTGISGMLPEVANAAIEIITSFSNSLLEGDNLATITQGSVSAISGFINAIIDHLPEITEIGKEVITQLITGILSGSDGSFGDMAARVGVLAFALRPLLGLFGGLSGIMGGLSGIVGKVSGLFGGLGSATKTVTAPAQAAAGGLQALTANAKGLLALGAGFLMVAGGMALLSASAVAIANAGPGAAAALVLLIAAVAGMAAGAAVLAPALMAGATGLVAFGAGVALVGVGILASTAGLALLATQLPVIAAYGGAAATGIILISTALVALAAGSLAAAGGLATLFLPMAGGAVTTAALGIALAALAVSAGLGTAAMVLLKATMMALDVTMGSIKNNAEEAGASIGDMQSGVDVIATGLNTIQSIAGDAIKAFVSIFKQETPTVASAATTMVQGFNQALEKGFYISRTKAQQTASAIKSAFENMTITIPKPKIPVISVSAKQTPYGDGGNVSVPDFSVSWNALGGIFDRPTIFNTTAGMQGVGEAGPEAILPLDTLWTKMREILNDAVAASGGTSIIDTFLEKLKSVGNGNGGQGSRTELAGTGGLAVQYSPTYNLYGSAGKEEIAEADRKSQEEFNKRMKQYEKERKRRGL